jgi:hypothetical protein
MMNGLVDMHIAAGNRLRAENEQLLLRNKQLALRIFNLEEALNAISVILRDQSRQKNHAEFHASEAKK